MREDTAKAIQGCGCALLLLGCVLTLVVVAALLVVI